MKRPPTYGQRRLEPLRQRLRRLRSRLRRGGRAKRQRVYLVTLGERRLKRIVFSDSRKASEVAHNLEALRESELVPELVAHYGDEVWVEFLDGEPVRAARPEVVDDAADHKWAGRCPSGRDRRRRSACDGFSSHFS